ncbi:MAG: hypothetical protein ACRDRH_26135 [Pseudonocardia sp.]
MHAAEAADGQVLEVSESIWPAERVAILDEYPIPAGPDDDTAGSEV